MKKFNTSPISGAQELLPGAQATFDSLKSNISHIYQSHGFLNVETPSIERREVLLAKAGGETEKQIYNLSKTSENIQHASQALRFDHTVPLARYVIEHENELQFPFKVQQVGLNFRGERAQKGRFREFYQCDIDVVGRNTLPLAYDADVIATLLETFHSFELNTPVLARISNRKILAGLLNSLNLAEKTSDISHIIDHAEKTTPEKTKLDLESLELDKDQVKAVLTFIDLSGSRTETIEQLKNLNVENELFAAGVNELDEILSLLEDLGYKTEITADMKIIRGLDYYTGTVFEFILPEYKNLGSVAGGGRYDNLTKYFSDRSFPGVGGSIGLTRLFFTLNEHGLLPDSATSLLDYAIIPIEKSNLAPAMQIAADFRSNGESVSVVLTDKKLSDKLSYAAKIAAHGIVIGQSEIESGQIKIKDFSTGKIRDISLPDLKQSQETPSADPTDFWKNEDKPSLFD